LEKIKSEYPGVPCFLFGHSTGGAVVLKVIYTYKGRFILFFLVYQFPLLCWSNQLHLWVGSLISLHQGNAGGDYSDLTCFACQACTSYCWGNCFLSSRSQWFGDINDDNCDVLDCVLMVYELSFWTWTLSWNLTILLSFWECHFEILRVQCIRVKVLYSWSMITLTCWIVLLWLMSNSLDFMNSRSCFKTKPYQSLKMLCSV
jgi:hypothetical protein